MHMSLWMHVEQFNFFLLLPIMQPNTEKKAPIKSSANCAIIHPLHPAGYQILSGVIDQNKTEPQTNTHPHTALSHWPTLCSPGASAVWGMWRRSRSEPTVLVAEPPGSKLRGHSERQGPGPRCRTLTRFLKPTARVTWKTHVITLHHVSSFLAADFLRSGK